MNERRGTGKKSTCGERSKTFDLVLAEAIEILNEEISGETDESLQ